MKIYALYIMKIFNYRDCGKRNLLFWQSKFLFLNKLESDASLRQTLLIRFP